MLVSTAAVLCVCVCVCVCACVCVCVRVCMVCFNRKINVFVTEETSDLHTRESLKYQEYFPILVFEGNLSIEIAL